MDRFLEIKTEYDLEAIGRASRRALAFHVLCLSLSACVMILSCVIIILHGSNLAVFLTALAAIIISAVGIWYQLRTSRIGRLGDFVGTVRGVEVELKSLRSTAGWDIGLFKRKYDHYRREELRVGVVVENEDGAVMYKLWGVSQKHAEYYKEGDEVVHVSGARFPVKTSQGGGEYLCPLCGEFNSREHECCNGCGARILKWRRKSN